MLVSALAGENYDTGRSPGIGQFHEFAMLSVLSGGILHTPPFQIPMINPSKRSMEIADNLYGVTIFEKLKGVIY